MGNQEARAEFFRSCNRHLLSLAGTVVAKSSIFFALLSLSAAFSDQFSSFSYRKLLVLHSTLLSFGIELCHQILDCDSPARKLFSAKALLAVVESMLFIVVTARVNAVSRTQNADNPPQFDYMLTMLLFFFASGLITLEHASRRLAEEDEREDLVARALGMGPA